MEQNKEGYGFVRFRWGETKEQDTVGGARLTIEIGAEFPIGIKSRLIWLSRTSRLSKARAPVNWALAFRVLLCPRKGLSPPGSCVAINCQRTFFRFATRTPSHAASSRGKEDVMSSHSGPTRTLPDKPSLDQLREQAKELLNSYLAGNDAAVAEVERFERSPDPANFALADAQRVLAQAYGF